MLLVSPDPLERVGGQQEWMMQLIDAWSTKTHIACVTGDPKSATRGGIRRRFLHGLHIIRTAMRERPDVILCGHLASTPAAWLWWRLMRVPYVVIVHGTEIRGRTALRSRRFARFIVRGASAVVANSAFTSQQVRALGADPVLVHVCPPGFRAGLFPGQLERHHVRRVLGLSDRKIILTVARLVEHKGHEYVIRALPRIRNQVRGLLYVIAGEGRYLERLQKLADSLDVAEAVAFVGNIDDATLAQWYAAADVFVLPSYETAEAVEGYGICLLEAGAFGLPVVASRSGGIPDAVLDGTTGYLVSPADPASFANVIIDLLSDTEKAQHMGLNARQRAAEEWDWRRRAANVWQVLENAIR